MFSNRCLAIFLQKKEVVEEVNGKHRYPRRILFFDLTRKESGQGMKMTPAISFAPLFNSLSVP